MSAEKRELRPATRLVHGGTMRSQFGETSEAMFLTQGFVYDTGEAAEARFNGDDPGFVYSRYANPTVAMFEERMCLLEGAEAARAVASGMAAVNAALTCDLKAGDHVVASRALFGSCQYIIAELLPRFGVASTLVDGTDLDAWRNAVRPETRTFFLESPANPTLELIDIQAVAAIAREAGARLVVDNVFATPLFQQPLALGAHTVVYSATKHIDGQGRCLGGVVLSDAEWVEGKLAPYLKHTGPSLSPFNAWVLLKSLETLPVRVERQAASAARIADAVAGHPAIARLFYPGRDDHPQAGIARRQMTAGGTMVAFEVKGGKAGAFAVSRALEVVRISNNLGDAKSLVTHPATTTHQRLSDEERAALGIGDGLLRLSVGLEDPEDLVEDLLRALDTAVPSELRRAS
ncbi:O-succinylhomoserine sulfhydrylase [Propylenella binzhouense]|uniref:O-succinylhomoserine sulfhydrylase n=1 Tax=Propylenella binzhouense TaxID=2555902 RepID=A0A964T305_9HYPH|nr:O-succinylhomoserine sulfhydrylase [Propylenella binzhouense]MYZ47521.1 O-succinylhomoserine sulfhydrylase [Propylenella binzhouense]